MKDQNEELLGSVSNGSIVLPAAIYPGCRRIILTRSVFVGVWKTYLLREQDLSELLLTTDEAWLDKADPEALDTFDRLLIRALFFSGDVLEVEVRGRLLDVPALFRKGLRPGEAWFSPRTLYTVATKRRRIATKCSRRTELACVSR